MSVLLTIAIAILDPGPAAARNTDLSRSAAYVCPLDWPEYPGQVMRIEVAVDGAPGQGGRVSVRFASEDLSFGFVAVGAEATGLLSRPRRIRVDRYILQTSRGHVLEFRRRETGQPFLPYCFELQPDPFLPICFDEQGEFRAEIEFLGEPYALVETADAEKTFEVPEARVMERGSAQQMGSMVVCIRFAMSRMPPA
jgi:hypothetical protein